MKRTFARALCLALLLCLCQPTALALEAVRANRSAMWFVDGGNLILRGLPREMEGAAVSLSMNQVDETTGDYIPFGGGSWDATVSDGSCSFAMGTLKGDGVYRAEGSLKKDGAYLYGYLMGPGLLRIRNGALSLEPERFEADDRAVYDALRGDSREVQQCLLPYYDGRRKGNGGTTNTAAQKIIDNKAAEITAGLTDPYEKTRVVYDWVCANIAYAYSGTYGSDPVTVLEQRRAVCTGYAGLTVALLRAAGVPAKSVTGGAGYSTMEGHAWVAAFVDGRWMMLDPTWGSSSTFENGQFTWKDANPYWFDRSIHLLSKTHRAWTVYWDLSYDDGAAAVAQVSASAARMTVDGKPVSVGAYVINGNNYFKLRDVAAALNGTGKQFSVGYDSASGAVNLWSYRPYQMAGGEGSPAAAPPRTAAENLSPLFINGERRYPTAYLIHNNNYFKLRDLAAIFDFGVDWDGGTQTIIIDTARGYARG